MEKNSVGYYITNDNSKHHFGYDDHIPIENMRVYNDNYISINFLRYNTFFIGKYFVSSGNYALIIKGDTEIVELKVPDYIQYLLIADNNVKNVILPNHMKKVVCDMGLINPNNVTTVVDDFNFH